MLTGNIGENFKRFKHDVQIQVHFMATESNKKSQNNQMARHLILLRSNDSISPEILTVGEQTVEGLLSSLGKYHVSRRNEVMENFAFFTRKQREGAEQFDQFYADLRKLAKTWDFGQCEETSLKTQIVFGFNDRELQTRLLREGPTSENVIKYNKKCVGTYKHVYASVYGHSFMHLYIHIEPNVTYPWFIG